MGLPSSTIHCVVCFKVNPFGIRHIKGVETPAQVGFEEQHGKEHMDATPPSGHHCSLTDAEGVSKQGWNRHIRGLVSDLSVQCAHGQRNVCAYLCCMAWSAARRSCAVRGFGGGTAPSLDTRTAPWRSAWKFRPARSACAAPQHARITSQCISRTDQGRTAKCSPVFPQCRNSGQRAQLQARREVLVSAL